ncbi:zinc permease [Raphidocelis subcapitata]|uniref:Zinc permease n=1 Tax=Raphidocelis subcapitata TaxID=307507 RepID=A0A2V0PCJ0_9CHLO|nr:zinc permease [Raphidocelis subcapitata]|eukprot:GBF94825.1 zinc permease [Raphidocelis subcapitata]
MGIARAIISPSLALLLVLLPLAPHPGAAHAHAPPAARAAAAASADAPLGLDPSPAQRLFEVLGAEEPLLEEDVARLIEQLRDACAGPRRSPKRSLGVSEVLRQFARGGVLDEGAAQRACTAIMACQLDSTCQLGDSPAGPAGDGGVSMQLRALVAVALGLEALLGIYIPILLRAVPGYEWWLSLLNCFSGGVFVAAGLVHLLPHCQEAQQQLPALAGTDYPLYLVLIVGGYMLVLFVERVLFSVHDAAHAHTHTGIVSRVASEELLLAPGGAAAEGGAPGGEDAAAGAGGGRTRRQAALAAGGSGLGKPLVTAGESDGDDHLPGHGHSHGGGSGHGSGSGGNVQVCRHGHAHEGAGDLRQGIVLLVAMSVHTFLECMALGLMDGRREFFVLLGAIASHKLISGLVLTCVGPFTLVAPAAIAVGAVVRDVDPMLTLVLSCFATGTFLYVGMSEIVEEEFEGDMRSGRTDISQAFARWVKFLCLLLGVGMIALMAALPDAHDHAHGASAHGLGHGHGHSHGHGHAHHHHHH